MRLDQLIHENSFVVFDFSSLHLSQENDGQNNATKLRICAEKTEALRFIKNYVGKFEGVYVTQTTFDKLKFGNFRYDLKFRRTDSKHFDLIKETREERRAEHELKRQIKKESEARHSLADTLQTHGCVLQLTEAEKHLLGYFCEKYKRLKFDFELSDVQYDFLTAGFVISIERGKTALVSNNPRLTNFYLNVIGSNDIVKPRGAALYRRVKNDFFTMIPLE